MEARRPEPLTLRILPGRAGSIRGSQPAQGNPAWHWPTGCGAGQPSSVASRSSWSSCRPRHTTPDSRPLSSLSSACPMVARLRAAHNRVDHADQGGPAVAHIALDSATEEFLEGVARAGSARSAETYRTALARFAECLDASPTSRFSSWSLPSCVSRTRSSSPAGWKATWPARAAGRPLSRCSSPTHPPSRASSRSSIGRSSGGTSTWRSCASVCIGSEAPGEKRLPWVPADSVIDALCRAAQAIPPLAGCPG